MKKLIFISIVLGMAGCTNAQTKKQIAADLQQLVDQNADCPTFCDAVKAYLKDKLQ
jgi:outer membrane murein-binding lipoprotein Lpp